MTHGDTSRRTESHVLAHDEVVPSTEVPAVPDPTVISKSTPLPVRPAMQELRPNELGAALVGHQLDHVLLEQFVGGGGMGAVFKAWDTELHRTVAVKVLSTHRGNDSESERRFQVEARSAARLDHPNIARVHYVGQDGGFRYIVFEYIDGTDIRDMVYANGPLPLADALRYTLQIGDALVHAWQREVVHRDIKPSNILVTQDGQAKLVDMGLARFEAFDPAADELTASGVTLGTFDYISPEQARDPRNTDTRSDIYSLGCTLFFMLSGRPPFPDGTTLQKLLQHQADRPPDVRSFRPDAPAAVVDILQTMLAKKPEDRFQNPAELVAALGVVAERLGMGRPLGSISGEWLAPLGELSGWRRHAAWLVPVVVLALSVVGIEQWYRWEQPPATFPELRIPAQPPDGPTAPPARSAATANASEVDRP
jgi:eukaryotic-like serine/threonine-protein kinase